MPYHTTAGKAESWVVQFTNTGARLLTLRGPIGDQVTSVNFGPDGIDVVLAAGGSTPRPGESSSAQNPGDGSSAQNPGDGSSAQNPGDAGQTQPGGASNQNPGDAGQATTTPTS